VAGTELAVCPHTLSILSCVRPRSQAKYKRGAWDINELKPKEVEEKNHREKNVSGGLVEG